MIRQKILGLMLFACLFSLPGWAKITLPAILGDGMVLQQQTTVRLWGKASPGKKVSIVASWDHRKLQSQSRADGSWEVILQTPSAGGPYQIQLSDGESFTLNNILIGEVWLCSGQSNMEMPVKGFRGQPVIGSHQTIVSANPKRPLRMFTVKRAFNKEAKSDVEGAWMENQSEAVAGFSATAYYFGSLLQQKLDVPIGLIHASWSASKIETWMSEETLKLFPEVDWSDFNHSEVKNPNLTPTMLFNAMIKPLENLAVRGIIWYQGEANSPNPDGYRRLFSAWVDQSRKLFRSPDMPIYYVQLCPYQSSNKDGIQLALFREGQLKSMQEIPHVGMAFTTDLGDEKFIHSPHKREVGERLAYWALVKTYGINGFSYCGPVFQSQKVDGDAVEIAFSFAEEGLNPENAEVMGFEIAGADSVFVPARAKIINGTARVKVWSDSIAHPMEIRYCFRNYMEGNLMNNAGLPAASFRSRVQK